MVSEVGVVCSEECLDAIKQFQARVGDDLPGRKRRWFLPLGPVRGIVALLVVAAIVYGILCALEGRVLSAPEALEEILSWIGL